MPGVIFGHQRAGKGGRVSANGTNMAQQDWSVTDKGDDLDGTTFESQGTGQGTVGIEELDYNTKGIWNAQTNAIDSPPGIFPQDSFPNLKIYISLSDNTFWNMPVARILSAQNGASVKQSVTFGWSGKSQGPFSRPTGSV